MAEAKISKGPKAPAASIEAPEEDTFKFALPDGEVLVVGKPQGVLKLRIRELLSESHRNDPELVAIAQAFLSIRTINGRRPVLRTEREFEALLNRFGSDDNVNEFMDQYQQLTRPEMANILKEALKKAKDEHWSAEEIQDYVTEKVMEAELDRRKQVRD